MFALLGSEDDDSFTPLKTILKNQGIEVWSAKVYEDVRLLLDQTHPELIFMAMTFFDGTWRDIVHLSEEASAATCAIVVGRQKDVRL